MALGHGAKIVTNGLVFAYDMGPNPGVNKSWKGKPTTNLVSDTISQSGWSGSYSLIDSATKTFNVVISRGAATGSAWRSHYWSVSSYVGSSVTISMDVELISENNATFTHTNVGQGNTGSFPYHIAGSDVADRVRVESLPNKTHMTWSGIINSTGAVGISTWINQTVAGGGVTLRISNVQIEANEFETPFVNGTRSNTEALLDWAGNNTITANSLTYNSDGTFSFASSLLDTTIGSGRNVASNPITIQAFVKSNTTSGARIWVDATSNGTNQRLYSGLNAVGQSSGMGIQGSAWNSSIPIDTNWHYQAIVLDGSTATAYDNGVVASSKAYTSYTLPGNIIVGGRSGYYWSGEISAFSVYDRALTADEVKTNFNALRGRYGI